MKFNRLYIIPITFAVIMAIMFTHAYAQAGCYVEDFYFNWFIQDEFNKCIDNASGVGAYQKLGQITFTNATVNKLTIDTGTNIDVAIATSGTNRGASMKFTSGSALLGQSINSITAGLKRTGTGTGTLDACVFDTNNNCIFTFGSMSVASLTTGYIQYTFTNIASNHVIANGNYIGFKAPVQVGSDIVSVAGATTNPYDGTNTHVSQFVSGTGFVDTTTWDLGSSTSNGAYKLDFDVDNSLSFTAKKHLFFIAEIRTETNTMNLGIRFNGDVGNSYASRTSINGAGDTSSVSNNSCLPIASNTVALNDRVLLYGYIYNNLSTDRKIVSGSMVNGLDSDATVAPSKAEYACKWNNIASQINKMEIKKISGSGDFASNSILTVWGYD